MPSRARRLRAEKTADLQRGQGTFDRKRAGRSLDLPNRPKKPREPGERDSFQRARPAGSAGAAAEAPKAPDGVPLVRLQRVLADAGIAARRQCEAMIEQGKVAVNNRTVMRLPVFVDPRHDRISVQGKLLAVPRSVRSRIGTAGPKGGPARAIYVMLSKPPRVMTTTSDDAGRTTIMELLDVPGNPRLFPIGRLDFNASGMVLLTNDGELTNALTHPRFAVSRTYQLTIVGLLSPEQLMVLARALLPKTMEIDPAWVGANVQRVQVYEQIDHQRVATAQARRDEIRRRQGEKFGFRPDIPTDRELAARRNATPRVVGEQSVVSAGDDLVYDGPFRVLRRGLAGPAGIGAERRTQGRGRPTASTTGRSGGEKTVIEFDTERAPYASLDDLVTSTGLELEHWMLVGIGGVKLSGLAPAQWRMLTPQEVRQLRKAAKLGERAIAAKAAASAAAAPARAGKPSKVKAKPSGASAGQIDAHDSESEDDEAYFDESGLDYTSAPAREYVGAGDVGDEDADDDFAAELDADGEELTGAAPAPANTPTRNPTRDPLRAPTRRGQGQGSEPAGKPVRNQRPNAPSPRREPEQNSMQTTQPPRGPRTIRGGF